MQLVVLSARRDMATALVILGVYFIPAIMGQETGSLSNSTNSTNDMYIIHATVYQVGIITNQSDEEVANMTGNQEALTFYHSKGSAVDLGAIPTPLVANVTVQSMVGVAPAQLGRADQSPPWTALGPMKSAKTTPIKRSVSEITNEHSEKKKRSEIFQELPYLNQFRRSLEGNQTNEGASIKVVKETALIPPAAGLQSIGLPSLVGLNTSFAAVPVPIPNTSVVRYAKVNSLVQST